MICVSWPSALAVRVKRRQRQHRLEPLPGDRLGVGELLEPVGAVDPAEAGVAHAAERQRRDRREGDHAVDGGHARPDPRRRAPSPAPWRTPWSRARSGCRWPWRPPRPCPRTRVTVTVGPKVSSCTASESSGTSTSTVGCT